MFNFTIKLEILFAGLQALMLFTAKYVVDHNAAVDLGTEIPILIIGSYLYPLGIIANSLGARFLEYFRSDRQYRQLAIKNIYSDDHYKEKFYAGLESQLVMLRSSVVISAWYVFIYLNASTGADIPFYGQMVLILFVFIGLSLISYLLLDGQRRGFLEMLGDIRCD